MENEKIIEKIKKCLALAANNPSEEEAKAAALQAQKLLAKYNIAMADIDTGSDDKEEITEESVFFSDLSNSKRGWKYQLAAIVAKNFRCRHFFYGKSAVAFYGYSTDVLAACEVFKFLFKTGDRLADREAHRAFRSTGVTKGVYNSFVKGYLAGLQDALNKQCVALMIVTPEEVKSAYQERSKDFGTMNAGMRSTSLNSDAYKKGFEAGKDAMAQRSIEG